jgi:hypothetical protein
MNFGDVDWVELVFGIAGIVGGLAMFFSPRFLKLVLEWTNNGALFALILGPRRAILATRYVFSTLTALFGGIMVWLAFTPGHGS